MTLRRLSPGRAFSWQTIHDDDGFVCRLGIFPNEYRFVGRRTYSAVGTLVWSVLRGDPLFEDCVKDWGQHVAEFVRRCKADAEGGLRGERAVDAEFMASYPALHEHLTLDWLEGSPRETSTLSISCDAGRWKARLCDRDNGLVAFISADGFGDVLAALERGLVSGDADWRTDQFARKRKPGK
jgi:hypothetical protein